MNYNKVLYILKGALAVVDLDKLHHAKCPPFSNDFWKKFPSHLNRSHSNCKVSDEKLRFLAHN